MISLIFTSFVLMAYTILFEYTNSRDQLYVVQQRSLEAIADAKVRTINDYFAKFQDDMAIVQENPSIMTMLPTLSQFADKSTSTEYIKAKRLTDPLLQIWVDHSKGAVAAYLLDEGGRVVYVLNQKHQEEFNKKFSDPTGICVSSGKKGVYISDIYPEQEDPAISFHIFAPIHDTAGKFIGEIVFELSTDELYASLGDTTGLGKTGETVLGRLIVDGLVDLRQRCDYNVQGDNVLLIGPLRSEPDAAFKRMVKIGSPFGEAIQAAAQGQNGSGVSVDYTGKTVLAAWRYLPERHWGMVTKINYDELMLPARRVVESSLIFGPLMFLILIIIAVRLAGTISLPIVKLTQIAKKIGEGDLDVKFDEQLISSNNEIGMLAGTLQKSILRLRDSYRNLEMKVQERTAQIADAQARHDAILRSIGDGVIATDNIGEIIFVNDSALNILHLKRNEVVGKRITDIILIHDEAEKVLEVDERPITQALRFGKSVVVNIYPKIYYFIRKDGSRFPVAITATPVYLQNKIIGAIEIFRDITVVHNIDKAKTEFVSLASHQLRTPLTVISWYAELLLGGDVGKLSKDQRKFLKEIHRSDHRMLALINALLNVSRLELGTFTIEPEMIDILDIARSIIHELNPDIRKKRLKLIKDFDSPFPLIKMDPRLIRIIIQNLLSNAVKFTPAKGSITISIKKNKPDLLISVADTGCGIPKSVHNKVFTKLFRADNVQIMGTEGTGLGLYLVKSIVNFMEGKIWFESVENKGSTFYVALPLSGVKPKKGTKFLQ